MRKGFSLVEILIAVTFLVPFLVVVGFWSKSFYRHARDLNNYYSDRDVLINKVEQKEGLEKKVSTNLYLKTVTQNGFNSIEYLIYK